MDETGAAQNEAIAEIADPVRVEKARLRTAMAERLEALTDETRRAASAAATARLERLPVFAAARRVFTCLSFGRELDTWPLVDALLARGREVFVPRADRADGRLHVHRYPCPLTTLAFGLRQPRKTEAEIPWHEIDPTLDVILVLGLAFDRRGYRLGYGSGFFDRFLAGRRVPAVGLAYGAQVVETLPVAAHDVPMGAVVTEAETIEV